MIIRHMRVISGIYKGRRLKSSADLSIRPTTDRIKESIFNTLQDFYLNQAVADLFCGSGNLGIEALSRGASKVYFVEKSKTSISVLRENLVQLNIPQDKYEILQLDAMTFVSEFDPSIQLFFMDPPFVYPQLGLLVERLYGNPDISDHTLLVVEHEITNPLEKSMKQYHIFKQKKFDRSLISFIEKGIPHEKC